MDSSSLPKFKYHPDPIATGSVKASDRTCRSCGRSRGFIYVGPAYAVEDLEEDICPWCIADGSAHEKFDAEFVDRAAVGGYKRGWDKVPQSVVEEVAFRTPGFTGIQQEQWYTHCGDAAEFVGVEDLGGGASKYNFRCRGCGQALHYIDID